MLYYSTSGENMFGKTNTAIRIMKKESVENKGMCVLFHSILLSR